MKPTRRITQFGFLALTLIGVFALGANCERWCPFGGIEAGYEYATRGTTVCSLGVSNFYILGGVLAMTLLLRRAFCGYACPIGTISEWLNVVARRIGLRTFRVPPVVDRMLGGLKYVVLVAIIGLTWTAGELIFRAFDPCYALISRHGTDITYWAYVVAGTIIVASLFLALPFCRWFCPLAAVLTPVARAGMTCVKRDSDSCVSCGKCAVECPMGIQVDKMNRVKDGRCTSCMSCVTACPSSANSLGLGSPLTGGRRWPQIAVVVLLLCCITVSVAASYAFPAPSFVKSRGDSPALTAAVELRIENLSCRGRANMLLYFLTRDDMYEIPGYLRLEAWPGPGLARIRVIYDPANADEAMIKSAITEPYHDANYGWRYSLFKIEGYDALDDPLLAP